jgi:hypothetical protein
MLVTWKKKNFRPPKLYIRPIRRVQRRLLRGELRALRSLRLQSRAVPRDTDFDFQIIQTQNLLSPEILN